MYFAVALPGIDFPMFRNLHNDIHNQFAPR